MSAYMLVERYAEQYGKIIGLVAMVLVFVFLWAPIVVVVYMSFAAGGVLQFPPEEHTLHWYREFINNDAAISSIVTTLQVSLVATPISVTLATMFAYAASRYDFRGKSTLQLLISLPIIVPLVVVGLALALFFGFLGVGGGYWPVVITHIVRTLPFAGLIILPAFLSFDKRLEEASMDLGANQIETFWYVTLPNVFPAIIAGSLLVFTISFNEFVYTYFVRGTGMETMPIYLWGRIQFQVTPEVNVMSVVFLLVAIILVLIATFVSGIDRLARF